MNELMVIRDAVVRAIKAGESGFFDGYAMNAQGEALAALSRLEAEQITDDRSCENCHDHITCKKTKAEVRLDSHAVATCWKSRPGFLLSPMRFDEVAQDLLDAFDPDWIGSHAVKQSFADRLKNHLLRAERRGAFDAMQPEPCPHCGPDGAVRHGDGEKICPECGGTHEKRIPRKVPMAMLKAIQEDTITSMEKDDYTHERAIASRYGFEVED
jgi:ribosomal protein L37AE/L43A